MKQARNLRFECCRFTSAMARFQSSGVFGRAGSAGGDARDSRFEVFDLGDRGKDARWDLTEGVFGVNDGDWGE